VIEPLNIDHLAESLSHNSKKFMVRLQTVLVILLAGWMVSACGVVPRSPQPPAQTVSAGNDTSSSVDSANDTATATGESPPPAAMAVSSLNEAKASLMQAYRDWKGTPYVLGGTSKEGVDCSRFVNIIFDEYFAIDLPTNTRAQLDAGDGVRRKAVRTGDLVFFKTGRQDLHVGIAVNQGEFLHASTSNGVMISKLGNSYWRNRFLAARRVL
jgi:cell wall-associated NlpC family hydrolase